MAVLVAFAFAILVPSALVVGWICLTGVFGTDQYAWLRLRNFAILVVLIASAHVVLLGLPAFLVMHASRAVTWVKSIVTGFLLGTLPIGLFTLPLAYSSADSTGYYMEAGKMVSFASADGWMEWMFATGTMGALGTLGGLSFWLVWRGSLRLPGRAAPEASA